jgi:hypothetical protein
MRAIAMVSGLQGREYELKELGMTTLQERRHQADMLMMYKVMPSKDEENRAAWFQPPTAGAARTRRQADPINQGCGSGFIQGKTELSKTNFSQIFFLNQKYM